jgi:NADH-quinone oxidoreductase subunit J
MEKVLFLVIAGIAVGAAANLLLSRHPIHSALSLIGVMGALAALYLMLGAEFIAAVQVIVYAGAIMVLFVFVIMMLNAGQEARSNRSMLARYYIGVPMILLLVLQVAAVLVRQHPPEHVVKFGEFPGRTEDIARLLFYDYVLPFEATSVLILVAIMGAVVLARRRP